MSIALVTEFDCPRMVLDIPWAYKYLHPNSQLCPGSLEREAPSGSAENLQRIFEMSYQRSLFLPSDWESTVLVLWSAGTYLGGLRRSLTIRYTAYMTAMANTMITVISTPVRVGMGSASTRWGLGVTGCEARYCSRALVSILLFTIQHRGVCS